MSGERLLTSREAADEIGCTIPQLRRIAEAGNIPFVKMGRNTLMFVREVVAIYKASLETSEAATTKGPWIYVIQMKHAQHVKIGKANDVLERIATVRCGNPEPLSLLVSVRGDRLREHRLHALLDTYRMEGEWFRWDGPIPELVERMRGGQSWEVIIEWLAPIMEKIEHQIMREALFK